MDRNLRAVSSALVDPRAWGRALVLGAVIAASGVALGVVAPQPVLAADTAGRSMSVPLAPNAPERYVVKKGDTLWDIAGVFLKDPWYWPEIWYVNPNIANPHLIYPGDELYLTYVDGKPRITVDKPGAVRLSPQVRSDPLGNAVRTIPYDLLMTFVGRPQLLSADELKTLPYVVGMRDRHIIGSDMNEVYAEKLGKPAVGTRYTIVHPDEELRDPDDGDLLGYLAHYAGTAEVVDPRTTTTKDDGITHLAVREAGREILQGDKLFPAKVDVGSDFILSVPANKELNGQVIAVVDGVHVAGKYQVLAINRGKRDGLAPGNGVAIFERGDLIRNRFERGTMGWRYYSTNYDKVQLPDERSGTILLFSVHDRMSYGLVVESTHVLRVGDFIAHPGYGHRDAGTKDFMGR
ncbi:MAG TPA: LysM peptidoglycan-binding domain-containing protein [Steroidobacteraceae bacterium]